MAFGGCGGHAVGRGAILRRASSLPRPGAVRYYKPVSVDEGIPGATTAIPGECTVNDSWRFLSNAPVAYQMQQMLEAKEWQRQEKKYPLPSYKIQTDTLLSLTQPHTTSAAAPTTTTTTTTTTNIPQKVGQTVYGRVTVTTEDGDSGNGLWEPCYLDCFPPPDMASTAEFPPLMQSNPGFRKKL